MARRSPRLPDPRLIDARNRVALSRDVLRALDVSPGDYVTFLVDESGAVRLAKLQITVGSIRRASRDRES